MSLLNSIPFAGFEACLSNCNLLYCNVVAFQEESLNTNIHELLLLKLILFLIGILKRISIEIKKRFVCNSKVTIFLYLNMILLLNWRSIEIVK